MKRSLIRLIGIGVLLGMSSPAVAQAPPEKEDREEIYLSVSVGYNTAYRDKSWVPVDVMIHNEQADLDGVLEVRTYDTGDRLQSPIYHLPINCPKDSIKRFKLMARLDNTGRLDARVLENGRPAIDTPSFVKIIPVQEGDLMAMILDDDYLNYTFLNPALQQYNPKLRLHRYALSTANLAFIPDHIKTIETFDFIVIGSIDPSRVSPSHRELIRQYAESGGVVIVQAGLNGNAFKGTWVEELAGVQFGLSKDVNETEAAATMFTDLSGRANRNEIVVTELMPALDTVQASNSAQPLVTKRALGTGVVYTLAVDSKTHAFQDMTQYRFLWSQMMVGKDDGLALNIDYYNQTSGQLLPNISGVNVRSLGFVVLFLMLYVGIGIIGNWIFWNARKRREMAWVCLVAFSFCFSAYAYFSGTAGWAKMAEKQQIDLVHIKPDSELSDYYGLAGILTARTRNYAMSQVGTTHLMKDISVNDPYNYSGRRMERSPFVFMQGAEMGAERFTVGASELRFLSMEGKLEDQGALEGQLHIDDEGIQGSFSNETPYEISDYVLFYHGAFHAVTMDAGTINIDISWKKIDKQYRTSIEEHENNQWYYYGYQGEEESFQRIRQSLFINEEDKLFVRGHPPMLLGWAQDQVSSTIVSDREMIDKLQKILVVAELEVVDTRTESADGLRREPLLVSTYGQWGKRNQRWRIMDTDAIWNSMDSTTLSVQGNDWQECTSFEVRLAPWMYEVKGGDLELNLYIEESETYDLLLSFGDAANKDWHDAHKVAEEPMMLNERSVKHITYRFPDYAKAFKTRQSILTFKLYGDFGKSNKNVQIRYGISATGMEEIQNDNTGEWPQWQ